VNTWAFSAWAGAMVDWITRSPSWLGDTELSSGPWVCSTLLASLSCSVTEAATISVRVSSLEVTLRLPSSS